MDESGSSTDKPKEEKSFTGTEKSKEDSKSNI